MGDLSDYFAIIKSMSRKTCHGVTSQTQDQGEDNCTHYHTKRRRKLTGLSQDHNNSIKYHKKL